MLNWFFDDLSNWINDINVDILISLSLSFYMKWSYSFDSFFISILHIGSVSYYDEPNKTQYSATIRIILTYKNERGNDQKPISVINHFADRHNYCARNARNSFSHGRQSVDSLWHCTHISTVVKLSRSFVFSQIMCGPQILYISEISQTNRPLDKFNTSKVIAVEFSSLPIHIKKKKKRTVRYLQCRSYSCYYCCYMHT